MRRLARHVEMELATRCGESEGELALSLPTPLTLAREAISEHAGLYNYTLKANRRAVRALREGLGAAAFSGRLSPQASGDSADRINRLVVRFSQRMGTIRQHRTPSAGPGLSLRWTSHRRCGMIG